MTLKDVYTLEDAMEYIGNSKSWKKAWAVSRRKWELIQCGTRSYQRCYYCGFCLVLQNQNGFLSCEGVCPVEVYCGGLQYKRDNATKVIQYLDANKERIFAMDKKKEKL